MLNLKKREIDALLNRATLYEREEPSKSKPSNSNPLRKSDYFGHVDNRPQAVQKFQDFLAKHGPMGGWNSVDHNNFIRAWEKLGLSLKL